MTNVRKIHVDWYGQHPPRFNGGPQLAYQGDHLSNMVIFDHAPELPNYYLLVEMKTDEAGPVVTLPEILLEGAYWVIPNYYTQICQKITYQVCCKTESGDFEHHSAKFEGTILPTIKHDGEPIDQSPMFDSYIDILDKRVSELILYAGVKEIDSELKSDSENPVQNRVIKAKIDENAIALNGRLQWYPLAVNVTDGSYVVGSTGGIDTNANLSYAEVSVLAFRGKGITIQSYLWEGAGFAFLDVNGAYIYGESANTKGITPDAGELTKVETSVPYNAYSLMVTLHQHTYAANANRYFFTIGENKATKVVFIGDSYGTGFNTGGTTTGWIPGTAAALGLKSSDFEIHAKGGAGFRHPANITPYETFTDLLNLSTLAKAEVGKIVVCGGYNEQLYTVSQLLEAFGTFAAKARTMYPFAEICIGMIGHSGKASEQETLMNTVRQGYMQMANRAGVRYLSNVEYVLTDENVSSDYIHPDQTGADNLATAIGNAVKTGSASGKSYQSEITELEGRLTTQEDTIDRVEEKTDIYGQVIDIEEVAEPVDVSEATRIPDKMLNNNHNQVNSVGGSILYFTVSESGTYHLTPSKTNQFNAHIYENITEDADIKSANWVKSMTRVDATTREAEEYVEAGQTIVCFAYSGIFTIDLVKVLGDVASIKSTVPLTDAQTAEVDAKIEATTGEQIEYLDGKISTLHNIVNYGYDNEKTVLEPSGGASDGTYIGVERYRTQVKLNLQLAGYPKRVFLNGEILRLSGTSSYKNIDGRLQLQEGHKYRFSLKWLSGTATKNGANYLPEIYVYTSYATDYFDNVEYESSTERRKVFTAPSDLLNIAIYVEKNVLLEDAVYDVTLEEVFDAGIGIENYYIEEMTDTVNKARNFNDSPALVFPVVTDIHRYKASVQTFEKMVNNITYLTKSVKCDFVVNLGDTIEGNVAQDTSLGYAYDCIKSFASIGLPFFYTEGNHDNNPYTQSGARAFNIRQVFKAFYSATKGVTYNVAENGTDYFIDFENVGVRLVSINACNVNQSITYAYGTTTAAWLTNVALNTQNTVILIDHLSPISSQVWSNNSPTHNADIAAALQTFVNGGGRLIQFSGHSHVDAAFVTPWVSIMQVCQKFEKADITTENYQRITGYIDVLGNPDRTAETYSEDAWSVCIYKPFEAVLHMVRFGAGVDRHFHIDPIAPQTLTSVLDGVTWSSSDTSVATVSSGVVTGVSTGKCAVIAKDADGNYEAWIINVE